MGNSLTLCFKPEWKDGSISAMSIMASLPAEAFPKEDLYAADAAAQAEQNTETGKTPADGNTSAASAEKSGDVPAFVYSKNTVTIPFARYDGLIIADELGMVPFECRDINTGKSFVEAAGVFPLRPLFGLVQWSYTVYPRILPENYRSSPYFDFRAEPGGMNSAGLTFLILPERCPVEADLRWDLTGLPEGARGVWSLGTGNVVRKTDTDELRFTFYAAGMLKAEEEGEFGIYWFGEPPFDIRTAADRIRMLFSYMRAFFHDTNPVYRVFLRRDPFEKSGGGTALPRSFMSGYNRNHVPSMEDWFCVLAHEMVHNWPAMDDEPAGKGTWYTEGMAEYYSAVLPFRAGIVDAAETARHINEKLGRYYESPLRTYTNAELAKIYWSDRRAQPVPYGRGMAYLANTDAALRRAHAGSLDDFAKLHLTTNPCEPEDWVRFIHEKLGDTGDAAFAAMKAGELIHPDEEAFGEAFAVRDKIIEIEGKPEKTFEWYVR